MRWSVEKICRSRPRLSELLRRNYLKVHLKTMQPKCRVKSKGTRRRRRWVD